LGLELIAEQALPFSSVHVGDTYYLYSTSPKGMDVRTSKDRTAWTFAGNVFKTAPSGTGVYLDSTRPNDLWAPDVHYDGSKFVMYFTASKFGTSDSAIFLATVSFLYAAALWLRRALSPLILMSTLSLVSQSTTGLPGSFTQQGVVVASKTGDPYNAIDGNFIQDG
jgi:arabinan endo-1,5-alpha-L-arabinosidase